MYKKKGGKEFLQNKIGEEREVKDANVF